MKADDCSTGTMIMRASRHAVLTLALSPAAVSLAAAQAPALAGASEPLRLLGLSVAASGGPRDTLGLLVATVVRDGPADQAGITTGSRVLAVNGLAVRLSPNDIGRPRAADSVLQRFDEVIRSTSSSADVTLRIVGGGRTRNVSLATADRRSATRDASATPASVAPISGVPAASASPTPARATVPSAPTAESVMDSSRQQVKVLPATLATDSVGIAAAPTATRVAAAANATTAVSTATSAAAAVAPAAAAVAGTAATIAAAASAPLPGAIAAVQASSAVPTAPAEVTTPAPATLSALIDELLSVQLDLRRMARDSQPRGMRDSLTDLEHDVALLRARLRKVQGARTAAGIADGVASNAAMTPTTATATSIAASVAPAPSVRQPSAPPAPTSVPIASPAAATVPVSVPSVAPAEPAVPVSVPGAPKALLTGLELARVTGDLAVFLGPQADAALLVQAASDAWEPLRAGDVVLKVDGGAPELTRLRDALAAQQAVTLLVLRRGRTFSVALGGARQL